MHTGFFFHLFTFFSGWGLCFLHQNHWGVGLSLPPTCAEVSQAEGADQTSPHLGWRQERHIQVILKYNKYLLSYERSLCTDTGWERSIPALHLCWREEEQDGHSLGKCWLFLTSLLHRLPRSGASDLISKGAQIQMLSFFFPFRLEKAHFMQLGAHLASQPWILITLVIKYEWVFHYAPALCTSHCFPMLFPQAACRQTQTQTPQAPLKVTLHQPLLWNDLNIPLFQGNFLKLKGLN